MKQYITEHDAVRKEMTMEQILALPQFLGAIASVQCRFNGEYKYRAIQPDGSEIKTHIVLIGGPTNIL